MENLLVIVLSISLFYLGAATIYLLALALAYFIVQTDNIDNTGNLNNMFAILVPAHNEELLIATLCQSLQQIDYPKEKYTIFVIADNCSDGTVEICRSYPVQVIERYDQNHGGKGQALDWALKRINLDKFDAVFIVDADNYVDADVLKELGRHLNQGEQAIQCYNAVGNRDDSWFTQLLYVSRTIGNELYHEAKYKLGLSSYLMGNGLCFKAKLLQKRGWTAFSTGEDWEYYAQLVSDNIKIGFAAKAKVFHQESRSLNQATSQRLRWSSGRFKIAKTLGVRLFLKGIRAKNWQLVDASFPLIFPNYSLQINLTFAALALSFLLPVSNFKFFLITSFFCLLAGQFFLFSLGSFIAGAPLKIFRAILYAPLFLIWKSVIDILSFTGLYRNKKWVRTKRHQP